MRSQYRLAGCLLSKPSGVGERRGKTGCRLGSLLVLKAYQALLPPVRAGRACLPLQEGSSHFQTDLGQLLRAASLCSRIWAAQQTPRVGLRLQRMSCCLPRASEPLQRLTGCVAEGSHLLLTGAEGARHHPWATRHREDHNAHRDHPASRAARPESECQGQGCSDTHHLGYFANSLGLVAAGTIPAVALLHHRVCLACRDPGFPLSAEIRCK